jgi:competence protein ComEC
MSIKPVPVWKEAPFLRLIIPLMLGVISQWYLRIPITVSWTVFISAVVLLLIFPLTAVFTQFKFYWVNGLWLNILLFVSGTLLTYYQDISHHPKWINNYYKDGDVIIATLEEPLSEKEKSFKALATIQSVINNGSANTVTGSLLIYFQKDSSLSQLDYGSQIIFRKPLVSIKNPGNPGGFDYQRYCAFQNIYHQVFLKRSEFILLPWKNENAVKKWLFIIRSKTVNILHQYLHGNKEAGLAEALLIGYKDDLDKNLVQSYSNTGVVHIIAISGMQLALIYGFLLMLFKPLKKFRFIKWIKPITIIITLWLFSLMSGASPSVLRAAVMLTCIVVGESFSKQSSIYNNLAASAFLLLCYDPFWLWDVGFQLSYGAVLSIVIFMKPIYNWFYIQNKIVDFIWELIAISLAAQILTTPISIYYFHQFPNYFLLTNLVAVPLSSIVLFGELILLGFSFIPLIAKFLGIILSWLIFLMNSFIEHMQTIPFSLWNNLNINIIQVILLYAAIAGFSMWLFFKNKASFKIALTALLCFVMIRSFSFWQSSQQKQMIVYNVPQHQAVDFINRRNFLFKGDSILSDDGFLQNFHLKPSRIIHRVSSADSVSFLSHGNNIFQFGRKKILIIDQTISFAPSLIKINVDVIMISKNPNIKISNLNTVFNCGEFVFDASNAQWKINKWKQECEQLHVSGYAVVDKGAFVMNVD